MQVPLDGLRAGQGGMRARLAFLFCLAAVADGQGGGANGQGGCASNMNNIRTPGYSQAYPHRQIYGMDGLPAQDYSAERCSQGGRVRAPLRLLAPPRPFAAPDAQLASGRRVCACEVQAPPRAPAVAPARARLLLPSLT